MANNDGAVVLSLYLRYFDLSGARLNDQLQPQEPASTTMGSQRSALHDFVVGNFHGLLSLFSIVGGLRVLDREIMRRHSPTREARTGRPFAGGHPEGLVSNGTRKT